MLRTFFSFFYYHSFLLHDYIDRFLDTITPETINDGTITVDSSQYELP